MSLYPLLEPQFEHCDKFDEYVCCTPSPFAKEFRPLEIDSHLLQDLRRLEFRAAEFAYEMVIQWHSDKSKHVWNDTRKPLLQLYDRYQGALTEAFAVLYLRAHGADVADPDFNVRPGVNDGGVDLLFQVGKNQDRKYVSIKSGPCFGQHFILASKDIGKDGLYVHGRKDDLINVRNHLGALFVRVGVDIRDRGGEFKFEKIQKIIRSVFSMSEFDPNPEMATIFAEAVSSLKLVYDIPGFATTDLIARMMQNPKCLLQEGVRIGRSAEGGGVPLEQNNVHAYWVSCETVEWLIKGLTADTSDKFETTVLMPDTCLVSSDLSHECAETEDWTVGIGL